MNRNDIKTKIGEYFFTNPTVKLRVRQIERELKSPLPSVIRYCKELEKERLLKIESLANIKVYSADRTSKIFLLEKRLFNIRTLCNSGAIDFLREEYSNPVIVLFGSFSKGEDVENSDIDLYIETPKRQEFNLKKIEKKLNRKIQVFNYKNIREVSNPHLANNILNGIPLNNFIEVFT